MKKYLLLSVLLFPSLCLAQGAHRISQIIVKGNNTAANISPYAKIQVCVAGTNCQTAATVYSDVALTHTLQLPLTADESGNYDYYITSGCVDESISSPGQGTKFLPNVCPGNGQSGGGGGVNPSTVPFPICYYATAGSTCPPNAAKTDSTGNLTALSLQGNVDALLSQTTSTSNNGIFNALQTNNTNVFAGTSYNPTEASEQNLSYRGIFNQTQLGVQTPLAFNTFFEDYRPTSRGWFGHNPVAGNTTPFYYVRINQDDIPAGSVANWGPQLNETLRTCCGIYELDEATPGTGNWSTWGNEGHTLFDLAAGISSEFNVGLFKAAPGDAQLMNGSLVFDGGSAVGADEGGRDFEFSISESQFPYFGTVASTLAAGATIIPITQLSQNQYLPGELRPLIISTQPGPTIHVATVTGPTGSSGQIAGTWTTTEAITPDTAICTLASAVAPPDQFKGGTTPVTVNVNCPSAAIAVNTIACVASPVNTPEEAMVVAPTGSLSGGVQSITLNLRHGYPAGAYVAQGPAVCKAAESLANRVFNATSSPLRILTRVIAHQDAHTILYSSNCTGHFCSAPNGKFTTLTFPATTLSRDSSGNITMGPANISDFNEQFQGVLIRITSAADTTYNGVWGPVAETVDPNTGAATLVMASAMTGAAGTTTTTGVSYIVADSLFSGINQDITLTRNGTGFVTTTTCCDSNQLINGATITISSATDTSFNGIFPGVVEVQLGGGTVSLTWPQTGGAATTSTTGPTNYFVPGNDSNAIIEYPAASTVEVQNPTTHALDGTNVVEANQMQVNAGDTVEIQHLDEISSSVGQFIRSQWTPTSSSITGGMWQANEGSLIPDGSSMFEMNGGPPNSNYLGAGGTQSPSYRVFAWNTPFSAIHHGLELPPTDNTGFWFSQSNACGMYACTSPAAHFGIMELQGGSGSTQYFYNSVWHMDTGSFQETLSDRTSGNTTQLQLNPNTGLQFVGPAAFSNVLDIGVTTAGLVGTQVGFTNLTLNSGQPRAAFGNGVEGDGSATVGANQGNFPDLVAGITAPETFGTFVGGTLGTTTYAYVTTGVTLAGEESTGSPSSPVTQGPATLTTGNYLVPKSCGPPGSVSINIYRTVGGPNQGLIATGIPAGNCNLPDATIFRDTGLTANPSIQPPTANQTGNLKVFGPSTFNGPATFAGTGFPVRSGTASNTDLVGELTFAAATTVTYSFTSTGITTHPVCTVSPEATTATSGTPFVTYTGVASFTINFPVAFTGTVGYQCLGRN